MSANKKSFEKELKIKSSTENLETVRNFTKFAAEKSGFKGDNIDKIALAVDEACTNIIKHAYKNSPEGDIIIRIKSLNNKFIVSITDYGKDFDPGLVPEPDIKKYYKEHKIGGLGIYLMKKLMDEVNYSISANKNQVVLVKYLA